MHHLQHQPHLMTLFFSYSDLTIVMRNHFTCKQLVLNMITPFILIWWFYLFFHFFIHNKSMIQLYFGLRITIESYFHYVCLFVFVLENTTNGSMISLWFSTQNTTKSHFHCVIFFLFWKTTKMKLWFHCIIGWIAQWNHTSIIVFFLKQKKTHNKNTIPMCYWMNNST